MPSIRLVIAGRVQGVGYREWTVRTARGLGLSGWVRNRSDGTVEIAAGGPEPALAALRAACRTGPRFASVTAVDDRPAADEVLPHPFERRPSA